MPAAHSPGLSAAEVQALVEASVDIVLVFDRDGRYLKIGSGGERLYRSPEDLLGKRASDVLPEPYGTRLLATLRRAFETGESQRLDYDLDIRGVETWFSAVA